MEIACAYWWTYEEIEGPGTVEGESYLQRLQLFRDAKSRGEISNNLDRLIAAARI